MLWLSHASPLQGMASMHFNTYCNWLAISKGHPSSQNLGFNYRQGNRCFFSRLSWQIVRVSRKVDRHLGIYFRIKIYWCSSQQSTKVWFHFFLVPSSLWPRSDSIIARVDIRSHGQSRQRDASCPWDFLRCYPKRILIDHTITTKL